MEISDTMALGTYYMLKNIEDSGISLGGMVQDWGELVKEFVPSVSSDVSKQNSDEKLCPCGHEHKPRSDGRGLRTYCVEGSQCNSDKCKEFVSLGNGEQDA